MRDIRDETFGPVRATVSAPGTFEDQSLSGSTMRTDTGQIVYLADYRPTDFVLERVDRRWYIAE